MSSERAGKSPHMQIWTFTYIYIHANKYLEVCGWWVSGRRVGACEAVTKFNNNSAVGKLFDNLIAVV